VPPGQGARTANSGRIGGAGAADGRPGPCAAAGPAPSPPPAAPPRARGGRRGRSGRLPAPPGRPGAGAGVPRARGGSPIGPLAAGASVARRWRVARRRAAATRAGEGTACPRPRPGSGATRAGGRATVWGSGEEAGAGPGGSAAGRGAPPRRHGPQGWAGGGAWARRPHAPRRGRPRRMLPGRAGAGRGERAPVQCKGALGARSGVPGEQGGRGRSVAGVSPPALRCYGRCSRDRSRPRPPSRGRAPIMRPDLRAPPRPPGRLVAETAARRPARSEPAEAIRLRDVDFATPSETRKPRQTSAEPDRRASVAERAVSETDPV
jgi:hypothetical protein